MQVVIRVDGSSKLGSGHVMRCIALAKALRARSWQVRFVSKALPGNYNSFIEKEGFALSIIPFTDVSFESLQLEDAELTLRALGADRNGTVDWLVVDHYALDQDWERAMRPYVSHIVVIDDLCDRSHDCDLMVNQNVIPDLSNRYQAFTPKGCKYLLGPDYSLLQPIYEKMRREYQPRKGTIERVLIFFGGVDSPNMTEMALEAFLSLRQANIHLDLVLGTNYAHKEGIRRKAQGYAHICIHEGLPNLASLMQAADLAIGGGGVTHWERMCMGLPSIVVSLSENQVPINEHLSDLGLVKLLGHHSSVSASQLSHTMSEYISLGISVNWSRRCMSLVDGRGALRVWVAMELYGNVRPIVRQASLGDERLLLEWANDRTTRLNSFSPDPISEPSHALWLRQKLSDSSRTKFYIVETKDGVLLGQVRFDFCNDMWQIDYAVSPSLRGLRLGLPMLNAALLRLQKEVPSATVFAFVKDKNKASCRVFESLGFQKNELNNGSVEFKMSLA